jgi:HK97 family phage portal protein
MGLFTRLFGREVKASAAGPMIAWPTLGRPAWTPRDYAKLSEEAYLRNAVAYRCAKLIAGSAAAVPWILSNKGKTAIAQHPLLDLLRVPAPMMGGASLFEAFWTYLLLSGNGYLEGVGPDGKPPRELYAHRPDRMQVIPGPYGLPQAYEYTVAGQHKRWDVDPLTGQGPILHLKEFHPLNDWYGLGRVEPAAYGVDRHNAAGAHNKALLDNGARPSGGLVFKPITTNGQSQSAPQSIVQEAEKRLKERHGGAENAGKPMVFSGDVTWLEMGLSPRDMDFNEGKADAARDICLSFGVPHVLIVPGQSTYNNIREAKLELWEDSVLPLLDRTTDALNAWLCPLFGDGLSLAGDLDEISALEPRRESKRKSIVELYDKGLIDDGEAREALQYGPRPDGALRLQRGDGPIVAALLAMAQAGVYDPLYRYLMAMRLLDATTTIEQFQADFDAGAAAIADQMASLTPNNTPPDPGAGGGDNAA